MCVSNREKVTANLTKNQDDVIDDYSTTIMIIDDHCSFIILMLFFVMSKSSITSYLLYNVDIYRISLD